MHSQIFTSSRTFVMRWGKTAVGFAHRLRLKWVLPLLAGLILLATNTMISSSSVIPTISIVSVAMDETVTIRTHNYPANRTFTVRMGEMGTRGVGGVVVGTVNSGTGGTLEATFDIPDALKGRYQIALRLDSTTGGYYSYNWFYNAPALEPGPPYTGIPTFNICTVTQNGEVEIKANNFPPNQTFTVTMGPMFSRGIGGTVVDTIESGQDRYTFTIPANLHSSRRIAIRAQTDHAVNPYFAFNWFFNNDTVRDHCN